MFVLNHTTLQNYRTLRCVWVPAHIGANAPLNAVWILVEAPNSEASGAVQTEGSELSLDSADLWLRAA